MNGRQSPRRKNIISEFHQGEFSVVCRVMAVDEGFVRVAGTARLSGREMEMLVV